MATKFTIEEKILETLKDFKCLIPRYTEVKNCPKLLNLFLSRNRNPIWDLSNNKIFITGLKSQLLIENGGVSVEDHFIQRTKANRLIFNKLESNPNMELDEFKTLLTALISTVSLTKEEHSTVTAYAKKHDMLNYQAYRPLNIVVNGLDEFLTSKNILF